MAMRWFLGRSFASDVCRQRLRHHQCEQQIPALPKPQILRKQRDSGSQRKARCRAKARRYEFGAILQELCFEFVTAVKENNKVSNRTDRYTLLD
jgi:hypothetical protein